MPGTHVVTRYGDWREAGACRDEDPELFFPITSQGPSARQIVAAKAICARCEVQPECLRFALDSGQEQGVWGGTSEEERRLMRRSGGAGGHAGSVPRREAAGHGLPASRRRQRVRQTAARR